MMSGTSWHAYRLTLAFLGSLEIAYFLIFLYLTYIKIFKISLPGTWGSEVLARNHMGKLFDTFYRLNDKFVLLQILRDSKPKIEMIQGLQLVQYFATQMEDMLSFKIEAIKVSCTVARDLTFHTHLRFLTTFEYFCLHAVAKIIIFRPYSIWKRKISNQTFFYKLCQAPNLYQS